MSGLPVRGKGQKQCKDGETRTILEFERFGNDKLYEAIYDKKRRLNTRNDFCVESERTIEANWCFLSYGC